MNRRNDPIDKRLARVARQADGSVLLIVRDGGVRILTAQIPDGDVATAQTVLERAATVLERRGMRLARPWWRFDRLPFHFAAGWMWAHE
jgi:hypothetical protein